MDVFSTLKAMPNKLLNKDGSITDFKGNIITPADPNLADVYNRSKAIANKFPDKPVVITLDSIAACSTRAEIEGDMEDAQMATHARMMSKGLRKIKKYINKIIMNDPYIIELSDNILEQ